MKGVIGLLRFLIPLVVLYAIGYFVAGFSALSINWLVWLAILITVGNWGVFRLFKNRPHRVATFVLNFLVATTVIFMMTQAIKGGQVPLGGSVLAASLISLLLTLVPEGKAIRQKV